MKKPQVETLEVVIKILVKAQKAKQYFSIPST